MTIAFYVRAILRESRGARGRMLFFVACLAVGVAAVVGVASLVGAFEESIRSQSRELLGADLVVSSSRPLPDGLDAFFEDLPGAVERTDLLELPTMASAATTSGHRVSRLVRLEAVRGEYPLRGAIRLEGGPTREPAGEPEAQGDGGSSRSPLARALTSETAVVAPQLLQDLGIEPGDSVQIGSATFKVAAVIRDATDELEFSFSLGPRIIIRREGLERTGLVTFGSRIRYRALYRLPDDLRRDDLAELRERVEEDSPAASYLRVETHDQAQPTVRRGMERVGDFLGLVALLSLLLGGVGVAQVVSAWLAGKMRSIAILRCLGARPREVLSLYLAHVVALAFAGAALGCALGSLTPLVAPLVAPDLFGGLGQTWWQPAAIARGLVLGVAIAIIFSVPPLTAVWRVAPSLVFRSSSSPLPARRLVQVIAWTLLVGVVFAASWVQAGRLDRAAAFTAGLLVTTLALLAGARAVVALVSRLPRSGLGPYLRHGLAALARPGAGTMGSTVALGLGILVVVAVHLVESRLAEELDGELPTDAPSAYLWDVRPEQHEGVLRLLEESGAEKITSVPVVMARLSAVDGVPVAEILETHGRRRGRWALTREQRVTWLDKLAPSNRIIEGELWSDPSRPEVSLEAGFARDLDAHPGTVLRFDIQGVPLDLVVTSIREVTWQSFDINFFVVAEPGALDGAPHFRMVGVRLPPERESAMQDRLSADYSNVTVFRVRSILEKVMEILRRLALGVRLLGGFCVVVGFVILAGAVSATTLKRSREVALLRSLGLTRRGVARLLAAEYGLVGAIAGGLGAAGAYGLAYAFLESVLDVAPALPYMVFPLIVLVAAGAVAACGVAASGRALSAEPVRLLRE